MTPMIVYSGKFGSTRKAARAISENLKEKGYPTGCEPVSTVSSLSGIDCLIIGTPIYYGKWPKELTRFIRTHASAMADIRVLLFFTCLRLTRSEEFSSPGLDIHVDPGLEEPFKPLSDMGMMEKSHSLSLYLDPVRPLLREAGITRLGFFRGNLDFARLDFKSRLVMRLMSLVMKQAAPGEFLNLENICNWALHRTAL